MSTKPEGNRMTKPEGKHSKLVPVGRTFPGGILKPVPAEGVPPVTNEDPQTGQGTRTESPNHLPSEPKDSSNQPVEQPSPAISAPVAASIEPGRGPQSERPDSIPDSLHTEDAPAPKTRPSSVSKSASGKEAPAGSLGSAVPVAPLLESSEAARGPQTERANPIPASLKTGDASATKTRPSTVSKSASGKEVPSAGSLGSAEPASPLLESSDLAAEEALVEYLKGLDPAFGQKEKNVQVSILITEAANRKLETLGFRYHLTKKNFVSAAIRIWLDQVEGIMRSKIPTSRMQLTGLLPDTATTIKETIIDFAKQPKLPINAWLPRGYDAKISNIDHLLTAAGVSGVSTSKRCIIGSATIKFLERVERFLETIHSPKQGMP
jgi:hypothetical protein